MAVAVAMYTPVLDDHGTISNGRAKRASMALSLDLLLVGGCMVACRRDTIMEESLQAIVALSWKEVCIKGWPKAKILVAHCREIC